MAAFANPAVREFVNQFGDSCLFGQVIIRRIADGFSLRHVADQHAAPESLRTLDVTGLRELAQTTTTGAFRPNKTAPSLQAGWIAHAAGEPELGEALRHLYPGALADWFPAKRNRRSPTTASSRPGRRGFTASPRFCPTRSRPRPRAPAATRASACVAAYGPSPAWLRMPQRPSP